MSHFDEEGNIVEGTQRYLIDGGIENFSSQYMAIKPFETNCYECILATIPKATAFNSCTLANTPRIPEHCIQYVYEIEWQKAYPDTKVDSDDPKHI
jgi:ubiquitin-activating enzyme E1 C